MGSACEIAWTGVPDALPPKRQHPLGQLVGLGHHGGARLLQNLRAREVGGFYRKVGIHNAAARGRQVFRRHLQVC